MKYKFFVGLPHQEIHSRFYRNLLGGEAVRFPCDVHEKEFPDSVLAQDSKDAVWLFNDIYFHLHPRLKGRQILVGHGLGLGWFMTPERAAVVNAHFDLVFETGFIGEGRRLEKLGIEPSKIKEIAYTLLFEIPPLPAEPGRILFFSTHYKHWSQYENLTRILTHLDPALQGILTVHPQTPEDVRRPLLEVCRSKENLRFVGSQEELLEEYARCSCAVGQMSSVMVPFYFLKKPVILLRGRVSRNPFRGLGWQKIRREMQDELFDRILQESTKVSDWKKFGPALVRDARFASSSEKIFFPQNFDKQATADLVHRCLEKIA